MDSTKQQPICGKMNGNLLLAVKALPHKESNFQGQA
jgi:hypothetical protein